LNSVKGVRINNWVMGVLHKILLDLPMIFAYLFC